MNYHEQRHGKPATSEMLLSDSEKEMLIKELELSFAKTKKDEYVVVMVGKVNNCLYADFTARTEKELNR